MPTNDLPDDFMLSESQLREIIGAATRGAPHADGVTVAQLRQIAAELDISEGALRHAMNDVLVRGVPRASSESPRATLRSAALRFIDRGRAIAYAVIGGGLGALAAIVASKVLDVIVNGRVQRTGSGAFIDWPVISALLILTLANSFSRSKTNDRRLYAVETLATWLSFGLGWTIAHGRFSDEMPGLLGVIIGVFLAWGWLIIEPRTRVPERAAAAAAAAGGADQIGGRRNESPSTNAHERVRFWLAKLRTTNALTRAAN